MQVSETVKTFHGLKLPGMAKAWEAMSDTHQLDKLTLRDGIELLLQAEKDTRLENRIARLIHNARFRQRAVVEELETDTARGLSAIQVTELATGSYIERGMNVVITGPAGTGKSFIASALGDRACRQCRKVLYFTMHMLMEGLRVARLEGRLTNFLRKISAHELLILDDFGMQKIDGDFQNDFEQIIDDRYGDKALILCSQLPVSDWYQVFQSELIAEACLDRLINKKTLRITLKGESLRKKY